MERCGLQRLNCFICNTKVIKEKGSRKDCTKRNLVYEIKCLSCEEVEHKKIEEFYEQAEKKAEKGEIEERKKGVKLYKYIGETSRSGYERGLEHLDKLTSLSNKSMMLRHVLDNHQGEEISEVRWGMEIIQFKRSAFERQIKEAVLIQQESEKHHILNSKAEWNQSKIPRFAMKVEDQDVWQMELELKKEKAKEDEFERKLRELRKERNKNRLQKDHATQPSKKRKIDNEEYVTIRKTWGPPKTSAPGKTKIIELEKEEARKKVRKEEDICLTNIIQLENRVVEGTPVSMEGYEIQEVDWEKRLEEHKTMLEKEVRERNERIKLKQRKKTPGNFIKSAKS